MRCYYGKTGIATRKDIERWFVTYGRSLDDHIVAEHAECCFGDNPNANPNATPEQEDSE